MAARGLCVTRHFRRILFRCGEPFPRGSSQSCRSASHFTRPDCRWLSSSAVPIVSDADEDVKFPQAADSHLTPSIFDDEEVNKFVNYMMYDGKKSLVQRIVKEAFETIKKSQLEKKRSSPDTDSIETDPLKIFHSALQRSMPIVGVIPMRKSGKVFQVPTPLSPTRQRFLAMKWLIGAARDQPGSKNARMKNKLAKELLDAFHSEGTVIRRKHELHKRAEANRAFAHYRWW